jgi:hypothetical protein
VVFEPSEFPGLTRPLSFPKSPVEKFMMSHVNDLAPRTASATRRLNFNLLKRKKQIALEESDLSCYSNPDTRHSPKYEHRYSTRSKAKENS